MMQPKKIFVTKHFLALIFTFIIVACKNEDNNKSNEENQIPILSYSIINSYPHDSSYFTQGLTFSNGELYEGTGEKDGKSKLLKVDLKTGNAILKITLGNQFFGEGIAILHDTIYQLTWQNNLVFVYSKKDFKKIKEFPIATEGWGITTDGKNLIVSDGSGNLYFYEPSTFRLLHTVGILENGNSVFNLNELEFIDGFVYANQWQYPYILKIDPQLGIVVAKYDLTELWNRIRLKDPNADVPNGIAYDETTKKIYITGKRWPELYEVHLSQ